MARAHRSTRRTFWQSHLGKAQAQGLSLRAYARREGLSEHSLYAARRQARAMATVVAPESPAPVFAAVRMAPVSCELSLPGGIVLRLPEPPPASWLAALAREVTR
jgi:hypothetical protein